MNGTQCGVAHRSLDDRSDYSIGAASQELYQIAHGPESPRYLRALGVPMTFGRFGLVALAYADEKCLDNMLCNERKLNNDLTETFPPDEDILKEKSNDNSLLCSYKNVDSTALPDLVQSEGQNPNKQELRNERREKSDTIFIASKSEEKAIGAVAPLFGRDNSLNHEAQKFQKRSIPKPFEDPKLRAAVSNVLLYFGYPFVECSKDLKVCDSIWNIVQESSSEFDIPRDSIYHASRFQSLLTQLYGSNNLPSMDTIKEYVEYHFLPHCLKLCLYGNIPFTRSARGSKGEYETHEGTNCYPEPSEHLQSPLPDPCLKLNEQSIEAVGMASAVLRRVRLMRCIVRISSGGTSAHNLRDVLQSKEMRKSLDGFPVWWCPILHDTALLIHSSTRGLFSILKDRESASFNDLGPVFSRFSVQQHIRTTFFTNGNGMIPKAIIEASTDDEVATWIEHYANEFPCINVIERRLGFICSKVTKDYYNLPMFDHGGWPRN